MTSSKISLTMTSQSSFEYDVSSTSDLPAPSLSTRATSLTSGNVTGLNTDLTGLFSVTGFTSLFTMTSGNVTGVNTSEYDLHGDIDVEEFLQQKNDEFTWLVLPAIIFLGILSIVGVIGNSLVLYIYNRKLRKGTIRWFVQALAIFDLLSCVVAIPGEIFDMRNNYTFGSSPMCKVLRTVSMFCTVSSGMTLMVVAVERYKRICTPLRKQITPKGAQVIITVCTVAASVCAAPACIIYGKQTTPTDIPHISGSDCSTADVFIGTLVPLAFSAFQFLLFMVGAVALVVVYVLIGRRIWSHAHFRRGTAVNRRMSFFFNGSECSSPTTEDMVFTFSASTKKSGGETENHAVLKSYKNALDASSEKASQELIKENTDKQTDSELTRNNVSLISNKEKDENSVTINNGIDIECRCTNINDSNVDGEDKFLNIVPTSSEESNHAETESEQCGKNKRVRKTAVYEKPSFDATDEDSANASEGSPTHNSVPFGTEGVEGSAKEKCLTYVNQHFFKRFPSYDPTEPVTPSNETSFGADRSEDSGNETTLPTESNSPTSQPSSEDLTKPHPVTRRAHKTRQCSGDSLKSNHKETLPSSSLEAPAGDVSKAFDVIRRKKPSPPSRQTSRDQRRSGDSSVLKGRYRRRSTQHGQSEHMRRLLSRSDSVKSGTRRTTLMLFLITLVYLLSFLPYLVLMVLKALDQDSLSGLGDWREVAHNILLRSYFINSMANPIIYSYCSRTFRAQCSGIVRCKCCKCPLFVY